MIPALLAATALAGSVALTGDSAGGVSLVSRQLPEGAAVVTVPPPWPARATPSRVAPAPAVATSVPPPAPPPPTTTAAAPHPTPRRSIFPLFRIGPRPAPTPIATPMVWSAPASTRDAPHGVLTATQRALHREVAMRLPVVVEETFAELRRALRAGEPITEAAVVSFIEERLRRDGLVAPARPVVVSGAKTAQHDFAGGTQRRIAEGDLVLLEIVARRDAPDAVHARVSWVAFAGRKHEIPKRAQRAWTLAREARDAALQKLASRVESGRSVTGDELDEWVRRVIRRAKTSARYAHAAGISLGMEAVGTGAEIRRGETRALADGACWSLRVGLYHEKELGVRTETDFCIEGRRVDVTTGVRQREIRPLLE